MCSIMGFSSKALTTEELEIYFDRTISRGPDMLFATGLSP